MSRFSLRGLPFLAGVLIVFGCGTSGADAFFSDSVGVFISFLLDRVAVVRIHRSCREKHEGNSSPIRLRPVRQLSDHLNWRAGSIFYGPDKTSDRAVERQVMQDGVIVAVAELGGLHHRDECIA